MIHSQLLTRLEELMPTGTLGHDPAELNSAAHYGLGQQGQPPACIVLPGNTDELGALVQYANENNLCLTVTSSTGKHRKGGITNQGEHILVDLSHWKKIDLIDRRNRVCRVEPGVTYAELMPALAAHGMALPLPLSPRSGKSVLAAVMDREPSTWANKQWDSGDPVASTEFLFGSGERFRTGAAGGPGSIEQQRKSGGAQKHPGGPSQTDFHRVVQGSQGTMGIATWITLRTEIMPTVHETFLVGAERLEDLLDYVYAVQRGLLGEQSFILNNIAAALLMAKGDEQIFGRIRDSLPNFVCLQNIAGFERLPKERLAYHKQELERIAKQYHLRLEPRIGKVSAAELLEGAAHSRGEVDWRDSLHGGC
jgi:FAD/FMN-containing dehydrogenase